MGKRNFFLSTLPFRGSFSHMATCRNSSENTGKMSLTPKGPKAIFRPFLKFGEAIVNAIFIKNS
jgi:hypothetical protein